MMHGMDASPTPFQTPDEVTELVAASGDPGSPATLARRLGSKFSRQRVANWVTFGKIPEMVVRAYLPTFRRILKRARERQAT